MKPSRPKKRRVVESAAPAGHRWGIAFALMFVVFLIFLPVVGNQFVCDDFQYLISNPEVQRGFSAASVRWAFTSFYASNWHPLTWLSHMLDLQLFGTDPRGHHLVNLLLHALNAALLFLVLARLSAAVWRSAMVAALFAVHPLHVESVAWIAERKDLLCFLFLLLALEAYRRYVERPETARYLGCAALFGLALMAKPMAVTFPLLLLLIDLWPLERLSRGLTLRRLFQEKIPLLLLSAGSSILTIVAQEKSAVRSIQEYSLVVRAGNALVSYVGYIVKMLVPSGLAAFYPHPGPGLPWWKVAGAGLLLALITAWTIRQLRPRPWLAMGWLWYLLSLVPVIGLVQVGDQGLADRYTYFTLTGLFIVLVWGAVDLARGRPRLRKMLPASAVAILLVLAALSRVQVFWWHDPETLFQHALDVTRDNWFAHISLAAWLGTQGDLDGAVAHYTEALRIRPRDPKLHNNLGFILGKQNKFAPALAAYRQALQLKPDYAEALYNLGFLYLQIDDIERATAQLEPLDRINRQRADQLRESIRNKRGLAPGSF